MEFDGLKLRIDDLKEAQKRDQKDVKTMELFLLWDFV